jgi:hypothetical protein
MRGIEIVVDGGGGDGRWRRNGRQDSRAAAAGQGDGASPSYLLDFHESNIPHTTGIHKQVGEPKKVRKKGSNHLCFEKGENGGLTFFSPFFNLGLKRQYPYNCLLIQYTFDVSAKRGRKKKVSCNHRP